MVIKTAGSALRERLRSHKVFTKDQSFYLNYHKFSIKSYGPQREKMSLRTKFGLSVKPDLFERRMFPKYYTFYLTRLFKLLCDIWCIYYMYPNEVIVVKNDVKVSNCISTCE